jgi:hypothetical protein
MRNPNDSNQRIRWAVFSGVGLAAGLAIGLGLAVFLAAAGLIMGAAALDERGRLATA